MDVSAPKIYFPQTFDDMDCPVLLLDLGKLRINSDIQKNIPEDGNMEQLSALMYDKFKIELSEVQILICKRCELGFESGEVTEHHVLDRLKVTLYAENSVQPKNVNLTRLKVIANIPILNVNISDKKFKLLMVIISTIMPNPPEVNPYLDRRQGKALK